MFSHPAASQGMTREWGRNSTNTQSSGPSPGRSLSCRSLCTASPGSRRFSSHGPQYRPVTHLPVPTTTASRISQLAGHCHNGDTAPDTATPPPTSQHRPAARSKDGGAARKQDGGAGEMT